MQKVTIETAIADVNKWLDYKKISEKKRLVQKDQIDTLVDAVVEGNLILNEDNSWKQILKFPLEGEGNLALKELTFKPRIGVSEAQIQLQKFKSSDADGRVMAYVLALTRTATELIKKLDTEDYSVCQGIAIFFI